MASDTLNNYINQAYNRWLGYATYHCRISRLKIEPVEVLNDVLCFMLEGETIGLERLMNSKKQELSELDFLVLHIIKRNIHSPRSRARYIKGQHCTDTVDMQACRLPVYEDDGFDVLKAHNTVITVLDRMDITQRDKEIFLWRFNGNSLKDFESELSHKALFDVYNKVLKKVSEKVQFHEACSING